MMRFTQLIYDVLFSTSKNLGSVWYGYDVMMLVYGMMLVWYGMV